MNLLGLGCRCRSMNSTNQQKVNMMSLLIWYQAALPHRQRLRRLTFDNANKHPSKSIQLFVSLMDKMSIQPVICTSNHHQKASLRVGMRAYFGCSYVSTYTIIQEYVTRSANKTDIWRTLKSVSIAKHWCITGSFFAKNRHTPFSLLQSYFWISVINPLCSWVLWELVDT